MAESPSESDPLTFGSHGDYLWLTSTSHTIGNLVAVCPELVLDKFLAVTSCDSGPLHLDEKAKDAGWQLQNDIAYSPQITSSELLPCHELYDEWYVFDSCPSLGQLDRRENPFVSLAEGRVFTFVNYGDFVFSPVMKELEELFWKQMEWIRPESYISESDHGWLTLVTTLRRDYRALLRN